MAHSDVLPLNQCCPECHAGALNRPFLTFDVENTTNGLLLQMAAGIAKAAYWCIEAHSGQQRKATGMPYSVHPARVALRLIECGISNRSVLAAAYCHDMIEDTTVTGDQIEREFGILVRQYVEEVTNDPKLSRGAAKRAQVNKMRELSLGASAIKLADIADNAASMNLNPKPGMTPDELRGYFVWCVTRVQNIRHDDQLKMLRHETFNVFRRTNITTDTCRTSVPLLEYILDLDRSSGGSIISDPADPDAPPMSKGRRAALEAYYALCDAPKEKGDAVAPE